MGGRISRLSCCTGLILFYSYCSLNIFFSILSHECTHVILLLPLPFMVFFFIYIAFMSLGGRLLVYFGLILDNLHMFGSVLILT